jgi:hypothetical protein
MSLKTSKKSNRGGKRHGAGRPKKSPAASTPIPSAPTIESDRELGMSVFRSIAADGSQPAAERIKAADKLLDRHLGKPQPAKPKEQEQLSLDDGGWGLLLNPPKPAVGRAN